MNIRSTILANRFREVMLDGKWVANTNIQEVLHSVSIQTANRTLYSLNSIALLSQHLHYYVAGILTVLNGGALDIRDQYSFNFPALETDEDWIAFQEIFRKDCIEFTRLTEQLSDRELDAVFTDEKYGTYSRNIDCMIEHAYYHLGQMVMLRNIFKAS